MLARAGADLVLTYREQQAAAESVAREVESLGRQVLMLQCDVGDSAALESVVAQSVARFGQIDILVSNAGTGTRHLLTETSDDEYQRIFDVNVKALLVIARALVPGMLDRGWGRVIAIGSASGQSGRGYMSPSPPVYGASKAALVGMVRGLARQCGPRGVTVNCVQPGPTRNDGTSRADPSAIAAAIADTPMGRFGEPEDIAGVVLFLASDLAGFVTGQAINVNGGILMA